MALQSTTALASITLQSSSASVSFTSIPSSYRDLIIVINGGVTGSLTAQLRFNNDSGSNYSHVSAAAGNDNSVYTTSGTTTFVNPAPDFGVSSSFDIVYNVFDYAMTDRHKTIVTRFGMSAQSPNMVAVRWASTSAINAVTLSASANAFAAETNISLYGRIA